MKLHSNQDGHAFSEGGVIERFVDAPEVELSLPATTSAGDVTLRIESLDNRVVRWVLAEDNLSPKHDADIVTGIPYGYRMEYGHQGGRIRFGPDGYLWITTGEAMSGRILRMRSLLEAKSYVLTAMGDRHQATTRRQASIRESILTVIVILRASPLGQRMALHFRLNMARTLDDEVNLLVAGAN